MLNRRRLWATAALGLVAAGLVWAAPRVSADADGDARVVSAVSAVSIVNNVTRRPILGLSPLTDGSVVDLTRLANHRVSLQAVIARGVAPSVVAFTMTGAKGSSYSRTEARAPYFLCGDYADCPLLTTPDAYTVTVQAYTGAGAKRSPLGTQFSVRFTVTATATTALPLDVLFVGNSLLGTENHATGEDTPELVRRLASEAGRSLNVTEVIHFGYSLRHTWDDGLVASALSGARRYDFIVLQEYSRESPTPTGIHSVPRWMTAPHEYTTRGT